MLPLDHDIANRLLPTLAGPDLERPRPSLKKGFAPLRQVLEVPGRAIANVYFIETGPVSILAVSPRDRRIEVGMIGREGMTGFPAGPG